MAQAFSTRLFWVPSGEMNYEAFSVKPDRLPVYVNNDMYKTFMLEAFWYHSQEPEFGLDFRTLQAGRTLATERIGNYQEDLLRVSVQVWQVMCGSDLIHYRKGFVVGLAGLGATSNQFERVRGIYVNGNDVSALAGLNPAGTSRSGVRVSIENLALPLGARARYELGRRVFAESLLNYSFLMDLTDVLSGSSPFSGWATMATLHLGWRLGAATELYAGYLGYVNHMAAPTGQGGLRLNGSSSAPEGIYVLWQENEIRLSAYLLGLGYKF
ncbi:MAG: hypothetical protein HY547_03045 [Elusimicrobia bacterium]|nr:hypothetical protein [Elusimicrobiota bacterium]